MGISSPNAVIRILWRDAKYFILMSENASMGQIGHLNNLPSSPIFNKICSHPFAVENGVHVPIPFKANKAPKVIQFHAQFPRYHAGTRLILSPE